jgi:hypothetical protein
MNYYYHSDQCVELNSENDTLFWANTPTNYTIQVQPHIWPPLLTYKEYNHFSYIKKGNTSILYYQYCGPLIVLLKVFAKYINVK